MELNNINLWFAKNESGEIITIDKINEDYKGKYYCPLCGSEIIPKALHSTEVSPHFAHIDRSKCSGESIIHYWVKNQLIKKDDVFEVVTNDLKQHMCKEVLLEQSYDTPYGIYKPDITIVTYKDEKIFIEVNYTNKKKVEDYYLKWEYLGCTVIEFSIKSIYSEKDNKIEISNSFKSIYYKGLKFNIDKESKEYISYKNSIKRKINDKDIKKLKEIEWFIDDIYRYNLGIKKDIVGLTNSFILLAKNKDNYRILESLYRSNKCQSIIKEILDYRDYFTESVSELLSKIMNIKIKTNSQERLISDRIKNNSIENKQEIKFDDRNKYEIFKIFSKNYSYFNAIFDKNKNVVKYFNDEFFWNDDLKVSFVFNIEIMSVDDKLGVLNILKNNNYTMDYICEKINQIISIKDYVIYNNDAERDYYKIKEEMLRMFLSYNNVISTLTVNNDSCNNIINFINENNKKYKYRDVIEKCINSIHISNYVYKEEGLVKFNIKDCACNIIKDFIKEYNPIQIELDKCKEEGKEHYCKGVDYFLSENCIKEYIINHLNDINLFSNYTNYGYKNEKWVYSEIKNIILKLIEFDKERYERDVFGEKFINKDANIYLNLINSDNNIHNLSKFCETSYMISQKINKIINVYNEEYDANSDIDMYDSEYKYTTEIAKLYKLKLSSKGIYVNNIRMSCLNDVLDVNEVYEKVSFVLKMLFNDSPYISNNIIDIYNKIGYIYNNVTFNRYDIKIIDKNINEITINIRNIGNFNINENSRYEDISNKISDSIRAYLYSY